MPNKKLQTKLVMPTSRKPGAEASSKSYGEPMRQLVPDDVNHLNVKAYDKFSPGTPRPFRPVYRFDAKNNPLGHVPNGIKSKC